MTPAELKAESFSTYPKEARVVAAKYTPLFRGLPVVFLAPLLRELAVYDWKFPVERRSLDRQLEWLAAMPVDDRRKMLSSFAELKLSPALEKADWAGAPLKFSEQLTAWLWTSRQIDAFRAAAVAYVEKLNAATPDELIAMPRLGIVLVGKDVAEYRQPLFRKLRPEGTYFTRVNPESGLRMVVDALERRAKAYPAPFAHWYIDGGMPESAGGAEVSVVSYGALAPVRSALLDKMRKIAQENRVGVEGMISALAQIQPSELGLGGESALNRFEVELLTQGSGTQVFSTTFVQWAARETLRRAQPLTLLTRFTPRQKERPMNELLAGAHPNNELDPVGGLRDAEMGGYYTWLNQQRLSEADKGSFLIWFEGHSEAVVIGPGVARGRESSDPVTLDRLIPRT